MGKTTGNNKRKSVAQKEDPVAVTTPSPKKRRSQKTAAKVEKPVKKEDNSGFVRANLLSVIVAQDSLEAWNGGTWYKAHCVESTVDVTEDIQKFLMKLPRDLKRIKKATPLGLELKAIFDRLKVKIHYTGWNIRFDETLSYDYLKVKKTSQVKARKRFATLPNGKKLRPSLLAVVERTLCQEDEDVVKPDYLKLAEEALGNESDFESDDEEVAVKDKKKKKKDRKRITQEIREELMQPSTDEEEDELPANAKNPPVERSLSPSSKSSTSDC